MAQLTVKAPNQIRDDILKSIKAGLISRGIANPNVSPNSDYYRIASALANQISLAQSNTVVKADNILPDTATDEDLDKIANIFGLTRRAAGPSYGSVILESSADTNVAQGSELIDSIYGGKYTVLTGGLYSNGDLIKIVSSATGIQANLPRDTVLKFASPPAYAAQDASLDDDGTIGGVDSEDDETLRARLLERLANPPGSGNASQLAIVCEEASSEVQKAFIYPCANAPGTTHIALLGYQSSNTDHSRDISDNALNTVTSAIVNFVPEYVDLTVTKCTSAAVNVCFNLTLPESIAASSPGLGNGWIDATPFPAPLSGDKYAYAYDVISAYQFSILSSVEPFIGQTIHYVRVSDHKLFTAKIIAVTNAYEDPWDSTITVDSAFPLVEGGDSWVFPGMVNAQTYLDAVLERFAELGPGEKLPASAVGLLPRALRRPLVTKSWNTSLDAKFLKKLEDAGDEVYSATWNYPITSGSQTPTDSMTASGSIQTAPTVYIPGKISFVKA